MRQLIESCSQDIEDHTNVIARIKINLGIDRDLEAEILIAIDEYNIAVCRDLANRGLAKLPRELRDMVYIYLVPDEVRIFVEPSESQIPHVQREGFTESQPYFTASPCTSNDYLCSEHYWRDEALGVDMARELKESFYRNPAFCIEPAYFSRGMEGFESLSLTFLAQNDRFGSGIEPQKLISKLSCRLAICGVDSLSPTQLSDWRNMILNFMKELFMLKDRAVVRFRIFLSDDWDLDRDTRSVERLMGLIFPDLLRLRRAKRRVTVEPGHRWWDPEQKAALAQWLKRVEDEA